MSIYTNMVLKVRMLVLAAVLVFAAGSVSAQTDELAVARYAVMMKDYDSAIAIYGRLYDKNPEEYYADYLNVMVLDKKYKDAEKLISSRIDQGIQVQVMYIDLGKVYKLDGKDKKANEQFDMAVKKLNGDDMITQKVAKTFADAGYTDYAIKTYEHALDLLGNQYVYPAQLAALYARAGNLDKALDALFSGPQNQFITTENVKITLLQLLGNDPKRLQVAQKNLVTRINQNPDNVYFADLLTWIYTQKNDWDGALMQLEAVDERNKENGNRLMNFARSAVNAKQYDAAAKAYDDVIAKGPEQSFYVPARYEKLTALFLQVKEDTIVKPDLVNSLMMQYDTFLTAYPVYYGMTAAGDYATVAAQYADSLDKGIAILQKAIKVADARKGTEGIFKLQLGDYYLLKGKIWDASLLYSQVDKAFKNDALGEDARFRNARLAYYRGDFSWAQKQLSVLKASTSELIANDALYLSVQITENVEDSNYYPLSRFAAADLLLFCNRDSEANALLDSISAAFPKHPLVDDILMQHARIAEKHHQYTKALGYLKDIMEHYGQDVLGDDAIYRTADIYQTDLHNTDSAKHYYEQLVIDFPGSTFVQSARQKLREINGTP